MFIRKLLMLKSVAKLSYHGNRGIAHSKKINPKLRARPGFEPGEPGTFRTLSENHTPRSTSPVASALSSNKN